MKKLFLSILLFCLSLSLFAQKNTGRVIIPESNLRFVANDDYTEVTITGFIGDEKFSGKIIEIPSKIQGVPVTAIGDSAFLGWIETAGINGLWIPDSVKYIGQNAFYNSPFTSIRLPEGLETIAPGTFERCKIKSINLPSSVKNIMSRAFYDSYIESFTIPEGCEIGRDGGNTFYYSAIKTLVFPNGTIYLYDNMNDYQAIKGTSFVNCDNLENIVIPDGLEVVLVSRSDKEYTLADFVTGKKITASFALQKKLKSVKVRTSLVIENEEKIDEYTKAFDSGDYEKAIQIANDFINEYSYFWKKEWEDRYSSACDGYLLMYEKKYLDDYNMYVNSDWKKAEKVAKEFMGKLSLDIENAKGYALKLKMEELRKKWIELLYLPPIMDNLLKRGFFVKDGNNAIFMIDVFDFSYNSEFSFTYDGRNSIRIEKNDFLKKFNERIGKTFEIGRWTLDSYYYKDYLYFNTTAKEAAEFEKKLAEDQAAKERAEKQKKYEQAFLNGTLHTNIACNVNGKWSCAIDFSENEGIVSIDGFKVKKSIFEKKGLKAKDVVKKILIKDESGNETELNWKELLSINSIRAPATLIFSVERGSGKKLQTLTISVPVEWNADEIKKLR